MIDAHSFSLLICITLAMCAWATWRRIARRVKGDPVSAAVKEWLKRVLEAVFD
jgi:hypothetical protein